VMHKALLTAKPMIPLFLDDFDGSPKDVIGISFGDSRGEVKLQDVWIYTTDIDISCVNRDSTHLFWLGFRCYFDMSMQAGPN